MQFVGRWLPNRNKLEDREKYCAAMLMLFHPWRNLSDIKCPGDTFVQTFLQEAGTWPEDKLDLLDNIQYYHESMSAVQDHDPAFPVSKTSVQTNTIAVDGSCVADDESVITEDMISVGRANAGKHFFAFCTVFMLLSNAKARLFSNKAMQAAKDAFVFQIPKDLGTAMPQFQNRATAQQVTMFKSMTQQLKQLSSVVLSNDIDVPTINPGIEMGSRTTAPSVTRVTTEAPAIPATPLWSGREDVKLSSDQQLAFDIICNHMRATCAGYRPPQLLMILQGYRGTGKTTLINEITKTFEANEYQHSLAKTAMSGIAATIIDAVTLHWWAGINTNSGKGENWVNRASSGVRKRRSQNIDGKHYIIVDEFSMMTKQMLACVSEVVTSVAMNLGVGDDKLPFGGINVILAGDPHQFPPVGNATGALYACLPNEIGKGAIGRLIYEQFKMVITLEEQKRVIDTGWNDMLLRLREGACTAEDVEMVESLILANCVPTTRFDWQPWNRCVLLTPRNATRKPWNEEFATRMFVEDRRWIYVSKAEDIPLEGQLSMHDKWLIAGAGQVGTSKLEELLEVAVGMRVMILINLSTQAEVANGTRGTVENIILDPREPELAPAENGRVCLQYPPALVVFRPDSHAKVTLEFSGLPIGCIPITPREEGFQIRQGNNKKLFVRRQFAMTAAYTFTHEKSQGQTLDRVIVDLANPGTLTPFHAYVSLLRAKGRDHIRILHKFDCKLLTTHPSEHLKEEDKRLKSLSEKTKKDFAAGMYNFRYG